MRVAVLFLCVPMLLPLAACDKKAESVPATPLDVAVRVVLPDELVSDRLVPIQYELDVGPGYEAPDCELTLFVHFVGEDGKKLFQDDHVPQPSSSQWQPGQKLSYSRLLVLPIQEKAVPFLTLAGLYCVEKPAQPFGLQGTPWREGEVRYRVASGTIEPFVKPISDELIGYADGWYGEEYDVPQRLSWRWMGREAKLVLANRGQDSLLYLEGRLPPALLDQPTTLRLRLNGKPLGQATTNAQGTLRALYHLKPADLGSESTAVLDLLVDQTFVPKNRSLGEDTRTLGLMITKVHYGADTAQTSELPPAETQSPYTVPATEPQAAAATPAMETAGAEGAATPAATGAEGAATPAAEATP